MDWLPDLTTLSEWLTLYGSFSLFFLLALGIIAFPVPEETLMIMAGFLIRHDQLAVWPTFFSAFGGSVCGITVSYLIGRYVGLYLVHKYGKWIGITQKVLDRSHRWFERFGGWAVFFGYFVPGVRHFTGVLAGGARFTVKKFMLFAYIGAFFWVALFLSIGYFFGQIALTLYEKLELSVDEAILAGIGLLLIVAIAVIIKKKWFRKKGRTK